MKSIIKDICYKLRKIYQIVTLRNKEISIISNNCIAGFLYHDFHLRFDSPTINLQMLPSDYVKFCEKLEYYLSLEVVEATEITEKMVEDFQKLGAEGVSFPVGKLGDITIYFQHYANFTQAKQKWDERKQRVHYDKLYFVLMDIYCTREEVEKFLDLEDGKKVVLAKNKKDITQDFFYLEGLARSELAWYDQVPESISQRKFYDQFDFKKWFNEGK